GPPPPPPAGGPRRGGRPRPAPGRGGPRPRRRPRGTGPEPRRRSGEDRRTPAPPAPPAGTGSRSGGSPGQGYCWPSWLPPGTGAAGPEVSGAGVPTSFRRQALELAWAVARVGLGAAPPVEPPRLLRPLLSFRRLPAQALETVRRALEDDAEFRARVAGDADE